MTGCLKWLIRIIILILALIGFQSVCHLHIFKVDLQKLILPSKIHILHHCYKIADFSYLNEEYKIKRPLSLFGYTLIDIVHYSTGQHFFVINAKSYKTLSKDDYNSKRVILKINKFLDLTSNAFIHLENFKINSKGKFYVMGQVVPFIRFEANVVNWLCPKIQGTILSVDSLDNTSTTFIATNSYDKYSNLITKDFLKSLKHAKQL